jgi:hypothetical protein
MVEMQFFVAVDLLTIMATSVWLGTESNAHLVRNPNPREGHFLSPDHRPPKPLRTTDLKAARPP